MNKTRFQFHRTHYLSPAADHCSQNWSGTRGGRQGGGGQRHRAGWTVATAREKRITVTKIYSVGSGPPAGGGRPNANENKPRVSAIKTGGNRAVPAGFALRTEEKRTSGGGRPARTPSEAALPPCRPARVSLRSWAGEWTGRAGPASGPQPPESLSW